jgi:SAM-dependent methyltransferase
MSTWFAVRTSAGTAGGSYARLLYSRSAPYYDLFHGDVDYEAEADRLHRLIAPRIPDARSLLDAGCGSGRHLEHLRAHYDVEGLDISEALLAVARRRLPGVPLHRGDLRAVDLGRRFDVVTCLFSAIGYAETRDDLAAAVDALGAHLAAKGLLLIEPWLAPADGIRFAEAVDVDSTLAVARAGVGTSHGGVFRTETQYLVARPDGVEHFSELHVLGLFELADYEDALTSAGLEHEFLPEDRGLFICSWARGQPGSPSDASVPPV